LRLSAFPAGVLVLFCGCISFGEDVNTTDPTPDHVERCRREMHILPGVEIEAEGFILLGSGIDDAIWFKFTTPSAMAEIFDPDVVDPASLADVSDSFAEIEDAPWWDASGRELTGGSYELPGVRFMRVGMAENPEGGTTVFVMWNET
jgi:hypothetical protein